MVKECRVIRNNDAYTLVRFDNIEIQFPPIGKDVEKVFVKHENDKYIIVDENDKKDTEEQPKKKISKRKAIIEKEVIEEANNSSVVE